MKTEKQVNASLAISEGDVNNIPQMAHSEEDIAEKTRPEIVPLHVSCSQRPDWNCGPCKAYGAKKPWELV